MGQNGQRNPLGPVPGQRGVKAMAFTGSLLVECVECRRPVLVPIIALHPTTPGICACGTRYFVDGIEYKVPNPQTVNMAFSVVPVPPAIVQPSAADTAAANLSRG